MKRFHQFAIGVHGASLVLYAWGYSVIPSAWWLVVAGWSCFYGALSLAALRGNRGQG